MKVCVDVLLRFKLVHTRKRCGDTRNNHGTWGNRLTALNVMGTPFYHNRRLSYSGALCTVRYEGPVQGTKGEWLGVEWDEPGRGKHSGDHEGLKYFQCEPVNLLKQSHELRYIS